MSAPTLSPAPAPRPRSLAGLRVQQRPDATSTDVLAPRTTAEWVVSIDGDGEARSA